MIVICVLVGAVAEVLLDTFRRAIVINYSTSVTGSVSKSANITVYNQGSVMNMSLAAAELQDGSLFIPYGTDERAVLFVQQLFADWSPLFVRVPTNAVVFSSAVANVDGLFNLTIACLLFMLSGGSWRCYRCFPASLNDFRHAFISTTDCVKCFLMLLSSASCADPVAGDCPCGPYPGSDDTAAGTWFIACRKRCVFSGLFVHQMLSANG